MEKACGAGVRSHQVLRRSLGRGAAALPVALDHELAPPQREALEDEG